MGRYRPDMIDGVAGLALGGGFARAPAPPPRAPRPLTAAEFAGRALPAGHLISEPEPATGTLEQWLAYRRRVGPLAGRDPGMRLALAVAEAQIAKLRARVATQDTHPPQDDRED